MKKDLKVTKGKLRYDLLPIEAIQEVVKAFMYGADKYEDWNWLGDNTKWSSYYDAGRRHGDADWMGEDKDSDSGLSHLAHEIASKIILLTLKMQEKGIDDRRKDNKYTVTYSGTVQSGLDFEHGVIRVDCYATKEEADKHAKIYNDKAKALATPNTFNAVVEEAKGDDRRKPNKDEGFWG